MLLSVRKHAPSESGGAMASAADKMAMRAAVDGVKEVIETFENEPQAATFFASIFGDVSHRSRAALDDFDGFVIAHLPDLAHLGVEVLNRVAGMTLAENALTALYRRYLQ